MECLLMMEIMLDRNMYLGPRGNRQGRNIVGHSRHSASGSPQPTFLHTRSNHLTLLSTTNNTALATCVLGIDIPVLLAMVEQHLE